MRHRHLLTHVMSKPTCKLHCVDVAFVVFFELNKPQGK